GYGFSGSLTISSARSNDTAVGPSGADFMFDAPNVGEQGWGNVAGTERWRFVGTGTVGLPWDVRLSTVVTLSAGPSYGGTTCCLPASISGGPGGYYTNFGIYRPRGIGSKNL